MAVFTELSEEDIAAITAAFGIVDTRSIIGLADGDSETTYLFRAEQDVIVTLFETSILAVDVESACQVMELLCRASLPAPIPVRASDGSATTDIGGHLVAVVRFIDGRNLKKLHREQAFNFGHHLASLHTALLPAGTTLRERGGLPFGWIHGAAWPENVFFKGSEVSGMINYRRRRQDSFIAEIADVVVRWFSGADGALQLAEARWFLAGYDRVRALTAPEIRSLPLQVATAFLKCYGEAAKVTSLMWRAAQNSLMQAEFLTAAPACRDG